MTAAAGLLRGQVRSGLGDFGKWIARLQEHYQRKTGMLLYPGTLNVALESEWLVPAGAAMLQASEYAGTVSVWLVPCRFEGYPAWILRTERNQDGTGPHPRNLIEIATDIPLRKTYGLHDGDWVSISLSKDL